MVKSMRVFGRLFYSQPSLKTKRFKYSFKIYKSCFFLRKSSFAFAVKGSKTPFKDLDLFIISDKLYPLLILNFDMIESRNLGILHLENVLFQIRKSTSPIE